MRDLFETHRIPSGFPDSIQYVHGHVRNSNLTIADSRWEGGEWVIAMDRENFDALNKLCESQPQIWGNPKEPKPYYPEDEKQICPFCGRQGYARECWHRLRRGGHLRPRRLRAGR